MHELKTAYWRHHSVVTDHLNAMNQIREQMVNLLPFKVDNVVSCDNLTGWINRIEIESDLKYLKIYINPHNKKGNRSRNECVRIVGMHELERIKIETK
jgi:hypothetical protein